MDKHKKKIAVPIIVTVLMVLYFCIYFGFLISLVDGIWKVLLGILPPVFAGVMVKVCIDRIREIRKGEEDDLSQY